LRSPTEDRSTLIDFRLEHRSDVFSDIRRKAARATLSAFPVVASIDGELGIGSADVFDDLTSDALWLIANVVKQPVGYPAGCGGS